MGEVLQFGNARGEMNLKEAAAYLGYSPRTLYNKCHNEEGPRRMKRGNRLYFYRADLDAYLKETTETIPAFAK